MWDPCKIDITQPFDISFMMNFGDTTCGADGMSFVLQNDSGTVTGGNAGEHGFGSITNGLAVGFDIFERTVSPYFDPVYDSLNIQTSASAQYAGPAACDSGLGVISGPTCSRPQISASSPNIKDGLDHTMRFVWDPLSNPSTPTITVYVDGNLRAEWTMPSGYLASIFGSPASNQLWFGITAATGGSETYQEAGILAGSIANGGQDMSTNPCAVATIAAVATPLVLPTNACGTATPAPTFTFSPTPMPPTNTFTDSPTPFPAGCGTPTYQSGGIVATGQCGNSLALQNYTVTAPAVANTLLLVAISRASGFSAGFGHRLDHLQWLGHDPLLHCCVQLWHPVHLLPGGAFFWPEPAAGQFHDDFRQQPVGGPAAGLCRCGPG